MPSPEYDELPTEALLAIQAGRKLEAIRIVRQQTGMGLTEAKSLVDEAARHAEPELPPSKTASREDSGLLRLVAVLAVLAVLGALVAAMFLL